MATTITITLPDGNWFDSMAYHHICQDFQEQAARADRDVQELGCPNSRAHRDLYRALADGMLHAQRAAREGKRG